MIFWKRKEHTTQEQIQRGHHAKALLENELLIEAFNALSARYQETLLNTTPLQDRLRDKMYLAQVTLEGVKDHLMSIMATGEVAQEQLDYERGSK